MVGGESQSFIFRLLGGAQSFCGGGLLMFISLGVGVFPRPPERRSSQVGFI